MKRRNALPSLVKQGSEPERRSGIEVMRVRSFPWLPQVILFENESSIQNSTKIVQFTFLIIRRLALQVARHE